MGGAAGPEHLLYKRLKEKDYKGNIISKMADTYPFRCISLLPWGSESGGCVGKTDMVSPIILSMRRVMISEASPMEMWKGEIIFIVNCKLKLIYYFSICFLPKNKIIYGVFYVTSIRRSKTCGCPMIQEVNFVGGFSCQIPDSWTTKLLFPYDQQTICELTSACCEEWSPH